MTTAQPRPRYDPSALPTAARIPPVARPAWEALWDALGASKPPCAGEPAAWYSDDPQDRQEAVQACSSCRVAALCGDYADLADERHGVWASADRTRLPSRRRAAS